MEKEKRQHLLVTVICAIGIVVMECFAVHKGVDGVTLSLGIAGVAGLGGYTLRYVIK